MMFKLERTMNAQHKKTFERLAQNNRTEKFLFVVFFFPSTGWCPPLLIPVVDSQPMKWSEDEN